ncbi:MAG: GDSL-type esterase/lipase family protein [Clostridia bacterium]|nr:GDSL-type esterase/lipase family protein [Clostridia bacterium]
MTTQNDYSEFIHYRAPLTHTYRKLTTDKELNVVYFGGSVTAGYGSTNASDYSWRALSMDWLSDSFPTAKIKFVNTAIGESGTYLGTYRVEADVIAQKPDLLFIEYAINDRYKGSSEEQAALQYETIVREVRTALPECDIVTLLVTDQNAAKLLPDLYPTAAGHERIAAAYQIPTVNVGASLVSSMNDPDSEWSNYFIDIVHPTDAGYQLYFNCLEEFLYNSLLATDFSGKTETHSLPAQQSNYLLDGHRLSLFGTAMRPYIVSMSGFRFNSGMYYGPDQTPHNGYYYADSSTENPQITFRFTGTDFAIWTNFYDLSQISVSLDDGPEQVMPCDRHAPTVLAQDIPSGDHTITVKPLVYESSAGGQMKIGAVFVRDSLYRTLKYPVPVDVLQGDINRDGYLDVRDLVRLKKNIANGVLADLNADGETNAEDIRIEKQKLLAPAVNEDDDNQYEIDW